MKPFKSYHRSVFSPIPRTCFKKPFLFRFLFILCQFLERERNKEHTGSISFPGSPILCGSSMY